MATRGRSVQIYRRFMPFTIYAHKGGLGASHYPGAFFKHHFSEGGGRIVGRPDGSIVLYPHGRRRLWGTYPVRAKRRKVGNREPFLNPVLAVVNPPGEGSMKASAKRQGRRRQKAGVIHRRGSYRGGVNMAKKRHCYRRNPGLVPSLGSVKGDLMEAGAITAGLVGVPMLLAFVPLPAMFNSGWARFLVRGAAAYVAGKAAAALLGPRIGRQIIIGGMVGVVAEGASQLLSSAGVRPAPGLSAGYDAPQMIYAPRGFAESGLEAYTGYGGTVGSYTGAGVAY